MISDYRTKVERLKGKRDLVKKSIRNTRSELRTLSQNTHDIEEAQKIIQIVAKMTQEELKYHLSELVTLSLRAVFDEPYALALDFDIKRGRSEIKISFERDGSKIDPLQASGGGAVDIASFGLRLAMWYLQNPKSRNTLILDEPFKHLKGIEDNKKAIQMMKEISKRLGIQIITVSDERVPFEEIEKGADKIFKVTMRRGISKVKEV